MVSVVADQNRTFICDAAAMRQCRDSVVRDETMRPFGMTLPDVADASRRGRTVHYWPLPVGA